MANSSVMDDERFSMLSEGQRDALRRVFRHQQSKEIARDRGTTKWAVDQQISRAVQKLGARDRTHAALMLAEHEEQTPSDRTISERVGIAAWQADEPIIPPQQRGEDGERDPTALLDVRSPYGPPDPPPRRPRFSLPFRRDGGDDNDLSLWQRVGWIIAIPLISAVAFGMLAIGLKVLADLIWSIFGTSR
jgi:DNA-binding CsgD family transcriptional regulator